MNCATNWLRAVGKPGTQRMGRKSPGAAVLSSHVFAGGIELLLAEFEHRGASIRQPLERKPWGNRDFRLLDPFGNELKFTEPLAS